MNHNSASKTVYYVLTSCLAITFLAPLVWAVISSVSPAPGTAQLEGFGFGNYRSLFDYSLGLPTYLWHSVVVSVVAVVVTMLAAATVAMPSRGSVSAARTCSSCSCCRC